MEKYRRYTFSELCEALKKSGSEFLPVKGEKVDSENKKNNEKAVKDINKSTYDYNKSARRKVANAASSKNNRDYNSTTLEYRFDEQPPKSYTDRVKATALGYASVDNMKNSDMEDEGGLYFKGNEDFYNNRKEISNDKERERETDKKSGLKTREKCKLNPDEEEKHKSKTIYTNENKTMKRLHFKNTQFLSESHMLSKVPDCYKFDGNVFMMRDNTGTDYIVECKVDSEYNYTQMNVLGKRNKNRINEEIDKIQKLYNFKSDDNKNTLNTNEHERENTNMHEMLERAKSLITK